MKVGGAEVGAGGEIGGQVVPATEKKLFLVTGRGANFFPGCFGDPLVIEFEAHAVAESVEAAIDKIFAEMQDRVKSYSEQLEHWKKGEKALPILPDRPVDRERWRAEEVRVNGFEIVLRPITESAH